MEKNQIRDVFRASLTVGVRQQLSCDKKLLNRFVCCRRPRKKTNEHLLEKLFSRNLCEILIVENIFDNEVIFFGSVGSYWTGKSCI